MKYKLLQLRYPKYSTAKIAMASLRNKGFETEIGFEEDKYVVGMFLGDIDKAIDTICGIGCYTPDYKVLGGS